MMFAACFHLFPKGKIKHPHACTRREGKKADVAEF